MAPARHWRILDGIAIKEPFNFGGNQAADSEH